jgi:hypothetical protein
MPELGLPQKRFAYVEEPAPGRPPRFIGFIERGDHRPTDTRLAFRVRRERLEELRSLLERIGARQIEASDDMQAYPAIFFEDPAGTKLEFLGRL